MLRSILSIAALLITLSLAAQQKHYFKPHWKVGETKTFQVEKTESDFEGEKLKSEISSEINGSVEVLKENETHYTLEVIYDNTAFLSVLKIYETLGEEFDQYKKLKLTFLVDKTTGEADLINWKEAKDFVLNSMDEMFNLVEEKTEGEGVILGLVFMPIRVNLATEESVKALMLNEVGFLFAPFGKNFVQGDTIIVADSSANPFNPSKTVGCETKYSLSPSSKKEIYVVNEELVLDLSSFKQMVVDMMKSMYSSMAEKTGKEATIPKEKLEELNSIEFNMDNLKEIYYNDKTSWVEKVVVTGEVKANNLKEKSLKKVRMKIDVK